MENFYRDEDAESFHLISQNLRDLDLYLDVHFTDPLNKECTKIVEEIFRLLINNLDHGQPEHEELVEKMLDYTTGNWEGESIEKIEILTLYTRTHGGLPPDTLADTSRDGSTYLHRCAMHGNHGVLDYLLTNFVEGQDLINAVNHDGGTALRCAIGARSVECVKTLLQFGARLNIGGYDMALLHPGYGTPDDEIKELLLEAGRRQWAKNTKKKYNHAANDGLCVENACVKKSECPICSATVSDQQPLTCVPCCNASFHTRCLQQYEEKLENHEFRCPACRQDLTVYDPAKIGLPKVYPNPQRWSVDGGIEFVCNNLHPEEEEVRVTVANNVWLQVRRAIDLLGGADGPLYFNDIPITMDNTAATVDLVQSATQPIGSSLGKWRFRFIPKYTRDGYNGVEIALAQWAQFGRLDGKFMVFKEGRFVVIVYTAPISRKRRRIG